jgi:hypothetical protein
MRLYEFDQNSATITKIVALTNQLETDLEQGKIPLDFSLDELLEYFQAYDVILDRYDLYNMIKVPPLKGLIRNIQGDKIVFKGQKEPGEAPQDDNKKVVAQMAKNAMNN